MFTKNTPGTLLRTSVQLVLGLTAQAGAEPKVKNRENSTVSILRFVFMRIPPKNNVYWSCMPLTNESTKHFAGRPSLSKSRSHFFSFAREVVKQMEHHGLI